MFKQKVQISLLGGLSKSLYSQKVQTAQETNHNTPFHYIMSIFQL